MIIGQLQMIQRVVSEDEELTPRHRRAIVKEAQRVITRYEKLIDDVMIASMDNERVGDIIEKELEE